MNTAIVQPTGLLPVAMQLIQELFCLCLQGSEAVMALFNTARGMSRVHAARRFFDVPQEHEIDIPVIHQRIFQSGSSESTKWESSWPFLTFLSGHSCREGHDEPQSGGAVMLRWHVLITGASRDEQILTAGTEIGALLVDGLGDGVLVECPSEDLEILRLMSFGLLQVWP